MTTKTTISQTNVVTLLEETIWVSKYRGIGRKRAALARSYAAAMTEAAAA